MRIQPTTRLILLRHLLIGLLLLIPLLSGYAIFTAHAATTQTETPDTQHSAAIPTTETQKVAEKQPEPETQSTPESSSAPAISTPTPAPAPTAPAPAVDRLIIPSIGINSQYVSVGIASNGAVDVHPNLVGWWNGSAQPGSAGASFFDGHTPGVLSALTNVSTGASISIQKANGQTYNYTVVHRETIALAHVDMRKALTVYGGASEGLNLMTCAGSYIPSLGTTDQRLIVYAVRSL